jgi:hypothetical protein
MPLVAVVGAVQGLSAAKTTVLAPSSIKPLSATAVAIRYVRYSLTNGLGMVVVVVIGVPP